jgi:D-amino peptidase
MKHGKYYNVIFIILFITFFVTIGKHQTTEVNQGRYFSEPAPNGDGVMKILLYYDMEGISGQNDIKSLSYGNEEYNQVRELLTDDVNAVIHGLFAGGADIVHVVDAHGSGNPEPDILLNKMDSRAEMVYRDESFRPYVDLTEKGAYDAIAVVCMHSKTGGGGFAAHTYTIGMDWILNDMSINETEIIAYSWGQVDVPVIFASGDDKLEEQLEWMDWLEYVMVKKAKGAGDAELIPFDKVHEEMRAAAKRAVENISNCKAVHLTAPIKAQLRAVHPARLDQLEGVPGIDYKDQTVTFTANNFQEAYDGITALIGVATRGYNRIMNDVVRNLENFDKIREEMFNNFESVWVEVESGQWKPPTPTKKQDEKKKYFGVQ